MNKKKKIILIMFIIISVWCLFFITDSIRCENDKEPIFCIKVAAFKDGGSKQYLGLGYNYYKLIQRPIVDNEICYDCEETFDYVITPWFCDINYAQEKVSNKNK